MEIRQSLSVCQSTCHNCTGDAYVLTGNGRHGHATDGRRLRRHSSHRVLLEQVHHPDSDEIQGIGQQQFSKAVS